MDLSAIRALMAPPHLRRTFPQAHPAARTQSSVDQCQTSHRPRIVESRARFPLTRQSMVVSPKKKKTCTTDTRKSGIDASNVSP